MPYKVSFWSQKQQLLNIDIFIRVLIPAWDFRCECHQIAARIENNCNPAPTMYDIPMSSSRVFFTILDGEVSPKSDVLNSHDFVTSI